MLPFFRPDPAWQSRRQAPPTSPSDNNNSSNNSYSNSSNTPSRRRSSTVRLLMNEGESSGESSGELGHSSSNDAAQEGLEATLHYDHLPSGSSGSSDDADEETPFRLGPRSNSQDENDNNNNQQSRITAAQLEWLSNEHVAAMGVPAAGAVNPPSRPSTPVAGNRSLANNNNMQSPPSPSEALPRPLPIVPPHEVEDETIINPALAEAWFARRREYRMQQMLTYNPQPQQQQSQFQPSGPMMDPRTGGFHQQQQQQQSSSPRHAPHAQLHRQATYPQPSYQQPQHHTMLVGPVDVDSGHQVDAAHLPTAQAVVLRQGNASYLDAPADPQQQQQQAPPSQQPIFPHYVPSSPGAHDLDNMTVVSRPNSLSSYPSATTSEMTQPVSNVTFRQHQQAKYASSSYAASSSSVGGGGYPLPIVHDIDQPSSGEYGMRMGSGGADSSDDRFGPDGIRQAPVHPKGFWACCGSSGGDRSTCQGFLDVRTYHGKLAILLVTILVLAIATMVASATMTFQSSKTAQQAASSALNKEQAAPTILPTQAPAATPAEPTPTAPSPPSETPVPTQAPTPQQASNEPSLGHSVTPSVTPSSSPTAKPTTNRPTSVPTKSPTVAPTKMPTKTTSTTGPTIESTEPPTTAPTTQSPTTTPTQLPTTETPSIVPSTTPSQVPSTSPSTQEPTSVPTETPNTPGTPTREPTTPEPTTSNAPTASPTTSTRPSMAPSKTQPPTTTPTLTRVPTASPTTSNSPTSAPSSTPTSIPTSSPTTTVPPTTRQPSAYPSTIPSTVPTPPPSSIPSTSPTPKPVTPPPTHAPTTSPSTAPSRIPSTQPSSTPTTKPTPYPTNHPTQSPITSSPTTPRPTPSPTTKATDSLDSFDMQMVASLKGPQAGSFFGNTVALSRNGQFLAVGAPKYGSNRGQVVVYEVSNSQQDQWDQIAVLEGESDRDKFGNDLAISEDGSILVVGASGGSGAVYTYVYNPGSSQNAYMSIGNPIQETDSSASFGHSVALSKNGFRLVAGAPYKSTKAILNGQVRVYELHGTTWTQMGTDLDGDFAIDWLGSAVDINANGTMIVASAPRNQSKKGYVRAWTWNGTSWVQRGNDITNDIGPAFSGDHFGHSIALSQSDAGLSRVAIGSPWKTVEDQLSAGMALVYEYDGTNWNTIGGPIRQYPAVEYTENGNAVDLDGGILSVGIPGLNGKGAVALYRYMDETDVWEMRPELIEGQNAGDDFGVSLSSRRDHNTDGFALIVGALMDGSNGNGTVASYVKQN